MTQSKYRLRRFIRRFPALHLPFLRRKWEKWESEREGGKPPSVVVSGETRVVVDGFPRSGNSFFVALLAVTQPPELKMSHHLPSAAHIKEGVKRKLPVIVILREPREAVLAYCAYDRNIPLSESLLDWISFYGQVSTLPTRSYALARFEKFIEDGDEVVQDVNGVFEGMLSAFDHALGEVDAKKYLERTSIAAFGISHRSQPTKERTDYKESIRAELEGEAIKPLLEKAEVIYRKLCDKA